MAVQKKKPAKKKVVKKAAKPAPKAKAQPKPQAKPRASAKHDTEFVGHLIQGALSQIGESLRGAPKDLLTAPKWSPADGLRGTFTDTVQSIYCGAIDEKESFRLIGELSPFIDGAALEMVLRHMRRDNEPALPDPDEFLSDLVDQFVIRAMDDMARGMVALALGRPNEFPATCEYARADLERHVSEVKGMLSG